MSIFSGVNAREKLMGSIHRDSSSEPKRQGVYIGKSTGVFFLMFSFDCYHTNEFQWLRQSKSLEQLFMAFFDIMSR